MPKSKGSPREHHKLLSKDKYQKRMSNDIKENAHSHAPILFPGFISTHSTYIGRHRFCEGGYASVVCAALDANRAALGANYASHSARAQSTIKSPISFTHIPVLDMIERHAQGSPSNASNAIETDISNGACYCDIINNFTLNNNVVRNSNRLPRSSISIGSKHEINARTTGNPGDTLSGSDNAAPGTPQGSGKGYACDMAAVDSDEEELIPMAWDVPRHLEVALYFSRMPFDSWSYRTYARFVESSNSTAQRDYDEFDRGLQILASDDKVPKQIRVLTRDLRKTTTFNMFRNFVQEWRAESARRGGRLL
ncbi:hypothetical protein EDD21DRAFT_356815 [Dissophora ornata]|nr:hypothetical protein BGZ58_003335 [Dissophora ornata]KAI8597941.1 hypothetical protein EDD21DRAFT_356815 [Dissophora ornata]